MGQRRSLFLEGLNLAERETLPIDLSVGPHGQFPQVNAITLGEHEVDDEPKPKACHAARTEVARLLAEVALLCLSLSGCGLLALAVTPEAPGNVTSLDPGIEWEEIRLSHRAARFGSLLVGSRLSVTPVGKLKPAEFVTFVIVPNADALSRDLETLLRWSYDDGTSPIVAARRRIAPSYTEDTLKVYRQALGSAGLGGLFRDERMPLNGETEVQQLPAGDYLIFSRYRNFPVRTCCQDWAWLEHARIEPRGSTRVLLAHDNALCFKGREFPTSDWSSRCRTQ